MTVKVYPNYDQLSRATADLIAEYIRQKVNSLVCIASGHTPVGVFKCLIDDVTAGRLDIDRVKFLSLDEWLGIDPTDSGACLSMLKNDFFNHLNLSANQFDYFNVLAPNMQAECERINKMIQLHGGLDVMLVGVGTNGHIGMNEPGTSFESYAHIGELAEETKSVGQKYFSKQTNLSKGITLGLRHLKESKLPIVMASGQKKSAIMKKALVGNPSEQIPVTIVQLIKHGFIMMDKEAAG